MVFHFDFFSLANCWRSCNLKAFSLLGQKFCRIDELKLIYPKVGGIVKRETNDDSVLETEEDQSRLFNKGEREERE